MSDDNYDNLKDLFETFVDPERAGKAAEDIRAADEMMRRHPAPEPSLETVLKIKAQGISQMRRRRQIHAWRKYAVELLAAAAVLAVVASVGLKLFQNGTPQISILPKVIWDTYDVKKDDPALAYLGTELDQIEQQYQALQSPEETTSTYDKVSELEMEISEIDSEFWKE